jgi:AcrR family transcriptional regulator
MKEKILIKATEMYLSLGFKSVTMDDIAAEMGISKKTIYQYYENKSDLILDCALFLFETINSGIDEIFLLNLNPIEELFEIKNFILNRLNDEKTSPMYQLQKFYPKVYDLLRQKQFEKMDSCVLQNIERGVQLGLYRKSIDKEFVARIYFSGMIAIKDKDLFPAEQFKDAELVEKYLEYHLRSIATKEGIKILEQFQN